MKASCALGSWSNCGQSICLPAMPPLAETRTPQLTAVAQQVWPFHAVLRLFQVQHQQTLLSRVLKMVIATACVDRLVKAAVDDARLHLVSLHLNADSLGCKLYDDVLHRRARWHLDVHRHVLLVASVQELVWCRRGIGRHHLLDHLGHLQGPLLLRDRGHGFQAKMIVCPERPGDRLYHVRFLDVIAKPACHMKLILQADKCLEGRLPSLVFPQKLKHMLCALRKCCRSLVAFEFLGDALEDIFDRVVCGRRHGPAQSKQNTLAQQGLEAPP
mmetsp:Transcript_112877/g.319269  ORF Transcript_112877/g.319269 Transcript_112877/m.319269 type:complete len:272 (+) Transcript_112877:110-925(+)